MNSNYDRKKGDLQGKKSQLQVEIIKLHLQLQKQKQRDKSMKMVLLASPFIFLAGWGLADLIL